MILVRGYSLDSCQARDVPVKMVLLDEEKPDLSLHWFRSLPGFRLPLALILCLRFDLGGFFAHLEYPDKIGTRDHHIAERSRGKLVSWRGRTYGERRQPETCSKLYATRRENLVSQSMHDHNVQTTAPSSAFEVNKFVFVTRTRSHNQTWSRFNPEPILKRSCHAFIDDLRQPTVTHVHDFVSSA